MALKVFRFNNTPGKASPVTIVLAAVVSIMILTASIFIATKVFSSPWRKVEDTNGTTNTSLAMITSDELLTTSASHYAVKLSEHSSGERTLVSDQLRMYDYDSYQMSSKKTSGIYTLQATKVEADQLVLNITSRLNSGNMEIIIIVDGEYHSHIDVNCEQSLVLDDIAGKTVVVRMAAECAKVQVSISRSY